MNKFAKLISASVAGLALAMGGAMSAPLDAHAATANPVMARPGWKTNSIASMQRNLIKLQLLAPGNATGLYGPRTQAAVKAFEVKYKQPVTVVVSKKLYDLIAAKAAAYKPVVKQVRLDKRCLTGARVICAVKANRAVYYLNNGKIVKTFDARFGRPALPTRNGTFKVYWKDKNHYSTLYHVYMPYSMFFSGGEAVHYSVDFSQNGYGLGSHGCINIKDKPGIAWMFNQVKVGDKVVVY